MQIRRVGAELSHADGWTDRQGGLVAILRTRLKTENRISAQEHNM